MPLVCDYLVLGSGVAGLSFALEAAAHGDVVIVTKRNRDESNTKYAQGGIASVLSETDTFAAHVADTMAAGAGLCHDVVVDPCLREGPGRIAMLRDIRGRFTRPGSHETDADLDLARQRG